MRGRNEEKGDKGEGRRGNMDEFESPEPKSAARATEKSPEDGGIPRSLSMPIIKPLDDDVDLQRRELERLLTTAKDERRKSFIENAIASLDLSTSAAAAEASAGSSDVAFSATGKAGSAALPLNAMPMHPGLKSVLMGGSETAPFDSFMIGSGGLLQGGRSLQSSSSSSFSAPPPAAYSKQPGTQRPMSANVRRPSMTSLLQAIPENRTIIHGTGVYIVCVIY